MNKRKPLQKETCLHSAGESAGKCSAITTALSGLPMTSAFQLCSTHQNFLTSSHDQDQGQGSHKSESESQVLLCLVHGFLTAEALLAPACSKVSIHPSIQPASQPSVPSHPSHPIPSHPVPPLPSRPVPSIHPIHLKAIHPSGQVSSPARRRSSLQPLHCRKCFLSTDPTFGENGWPMSYVMQTLDEQNLPYEEVFQYIKWGDRFIHQESTFTST